MNFRIGLLSAAACFVVACTAAPKETVELSEVVGEQLKEMQRSHEGFVQRYYSKLREDVDRFMIEKWTPNFLARATRNPGFRAVHDKYYPIAKLSDADLDRITFDVRGIEGAANQAVFRDAIKRAVRSQRANWGKTMVGFGEAATKEIKKRREELLKPINEQEAYVLAKLREAYADLVRATATIKAYLQSVVTLKEKQDAILKKANLIEARDKLINKAIGFNDDLVKGMRKMGVDDKALRAYSRIDMELEQLAKDQAALRGKQGAPAQTALAERLGKLVEGVKALEEGMEQGDATSRAVEAAKASMEAAAGKMDGDGFDADQKEAEAKLGESRKALTKMIEDALKAKFKDFTDGLENVNKALKEG